jgi:hypothetical protein
MPRISAREKINQSNEQRRLFAGQQFIKEIRLLNGQDQDNIPDEIYLIIRKEIENSNSSISNLTPCDINRYLKKYGYNEYAKSYEHSFTILKTLKHGQRIIITPTMESELYLLFMQIGSTSTTLHSLEYSMQITGRDTIIFPSYKYLLYQLCKLIGNSDATALLYPRYFTDFHPNPIDPYFNRNERYHKQWNKICQILSDEQEIELKNHINTKVTSLLSIIFNLPYNHIIKNISHHIYILTKNDLFWIRAFNNLEYT